MEKEEYFTHFEHVQTEPNTHYNIFLPKVHKACKNRFNVEAEYKNNLSSTKK